MKLATVAKLFDVTPKTIRRWVDEGRFPEPVPFGNVKLFRSSEVKAFQDKGLEDRMRARILGGKAGHSGTKRDTPPKAP